MNWTVRFYEDEGWEPAKEFLIEELTNAERTRFVKRVQYVQNEGLQVRSDVLESVEDEQNLYSLRLPKSQNNPRFLLCTLSGERTFVVLHGFKEGSSSDYNSAIEVAKNRRNKLESE